MLGMGRAPWRFGRRGKESAVCLDTDCTYSSSSTSKRCHFVSTNSLDRGNETSQTEATEIRAHYTETDRRVEMEPHGSGTSRLKGHSFCLCFRRCHIISDGRLAGRRPGPRPVDRPRKDPTKRLTRPRHVSGMARAPRSRAGLGNLSYSSSARLPSTVSDGNSWDTMVRSL